MIPAPASFHYENLERVQGLVERSHGKLKNRALYRWLTAPAVLWLSRSRRHPSHGPKLPLQRFTVVPGLFTLTEEKEPDAVRGSEQKLRLPTLGDLSVAASIQIEEALRYSLVSCVVHDTVYSGRYRSHLLTQDIWKGLLRSQGQVAHLGCCRVWSKPTPSPRRQTSLTVHPHIVTIDNEASQRRSPGQDRPLQGLHWRGDGQSSAPSESYLTCTKLDHPVSVTRQKLSWTRKGLQLRIIRATRIVVRIYGIFNASVRVPHPASSTGTSAQHLAPPASLRHRYATPASGHGGPSEPLPGSWLRNRPC